MSADDSQHRFDVNPTVFWTSAVMIFGFSAVGAVAANAVQDLFSVVLRWITDQTGWLYIGSMGFFLGFAVWLGFGRHGHLRLGPDDARPEFSRLSWLSMLFSADMGIGLLFYGVAEPVLHYAKPPSGDPGTVEAARRAMTLTYFHWGLHPWAVYTIVGLALAYFGYRKDLPLTLRSALEPLLGQRVHGRAGDLVDILSVQSTLFGVATSLGLGAMQINAGLSHVFGLRRSTGVQLALIAGITAMATASVVSGLKRGIRRLSELNIIIGLVLMLFVLFVGPTVHLIEAFLENLGRYLQTLPAATFYTDAFGDGAWLGDWTVFYWGWWISWSPFVGMFIARVSRGRTIREFVLGVLFVPTAMTFAWMTVFGNTALHLDLSGAHAVSRAVTDSVPTALFVLLEQFPASGPVSLVATLCVVSFFVTSSDSASLVIDIITAGGNENPPVAQRIFWAVTEGLVAAVLLLSGGLKGLQTATITSALPLCLALLLICHSLARGLSREPAPS